MKQRISTDKHNQISKSNQRFERVAAVTYPSLFAVTYPSLLSIQNVATFGYIVNIFLSLLYFYSCLIIEGALFAVLCLCTSLLASLLFRQLLSVRVRKPKHDVVVGVCHFTLRFLLCVSLRFLFASRFITRTYSDISLLKMKLLAILHVRT